MMQFGERAMKFARAAIMVNETEGVEAKVRLAPHGEAAVLITADGSPALPLADRTAAPRRTGLRGRLPARPARRGGEPTARARGALSARPRPARCAGADLGRGRPHRGPEGRADRACPARRRWTAAAASSALRWPSRPGAAGSTPRRRRRSERAARPPGRTAVPARPARRSRPDNYGLAADDLRRSLRIAPVVCVAK